MAAPESNDPMTNPDAPETAATEAQMSDLATQLEAAKAEASANYDKFMRTAADLENFRRRTVREKDELRQYAASGVLEDLLPVVDNLTLALVAAKQPITDVKNLTGGVEMVLTQLKSAMASHGLKEINPAGQAFDANHDAQPRQPKP